MKRFAVLIVLLISVGAFAKERVWQDAKVGMIRSVDNSNGSAIIPVNGMLFNVPINNFATLYLIDTGDMVYCLEWRNHKRPLNVTLHGKTKISVDGLTAHILDDGGKDVKLPITGKKQLN